MQRNLSSNVIGDREPDFRLRVERPAVALKRQPFPGATDAFVARRPPWRLSPIIEASNQPSNSAESNHLAARRCPPADQIAWLREASSTPALLRTSCCAIPDLEGFQPSLPSV